MRIEKFALAVAVKFYVRGNQSALDNRLLITHLACLYFGMKKSYIFYLYMRFSDVVKIIIDCISKA